MLFAWWVFGATALIFARFFKPCWSHVKWRGTNVWFQV